MINMKSSTCLITIILAILLSTVLTFYVVRHVVHSLPRTELKTEPYSNTISLKLDDNYTTYNKELIGKFYTIQNRSTVEIKIGKVNKNVSFIIFQVHTHNYPITLFNNSKVYGSYINGTNVGLYSSVKDKDVFYVSNDNDIDLKMYISVHGYGVHDPIPGGTNLEFPVPISPFMRIQYDRDVIHVDAQASSDWNSQHKFYKMDLEEYDFSEIAYFEGIKKMITYEQIIQNGKEIHNTSAYKTMRRSLSAYPGLGRVYAVVAINEKAGFHSVYVPSFSYACSPVDKDCYPHDNPLYHFFNVTFIFIGIFLCFYGHTNIHSQTFLSGFLTGVALTYLFILKSSNIYMPVQIAAAGLMGIIIGISWTLLWLYHGVKSISTMMTALHVGVLCSAIIYYVIPSMDPLYEDTFFWTMYCSLSIMIAMIISIGQDVFIKLSCSILGGYTLIFALDHYLGSNLKYIPINVLRRATVDGFRLVLLEPPFQWADILLTIIWIVLIILSFIWDYLIMKKDIRSNDTTSYGTFQAPETLGRNNRLSEVNEYTPILSI